MGAPAFIITTSAEGLDSWNGGQLIEDTGVITDMDGGFDTATVVVLYRSTTSIPALRSKHPEHENLFLFGISPRRLAGEGSQVTLTYKGVAGRDLGKGVVPALKDNVAKFSFGIRMTERSAAKGEIEGTIGGVDLSTVAVNVLQPQQTVRISWMDAIPIDGGTFNMPNGKSPFQFGSIDQNFYSTISNPIFNFPNGWVPIEASSDQAYPGIDIWANSITFVGVPEFSAS